jgi:hypothetical protein
MTEIELPTFQIVSFAFEDPGEVPKHIENYPAVPNYVGKLSLHGWSGSNLYPLAVDLQDMTMVRLLASARMKQQAETFHLYGYSDSVIALLPNGDRQRIA